MAWTTGGIIAVSMPLSFLVLSLLTEIQLIILFVGFALLGLVIGVILYRFPTKIVFQAEKETVSAFEKLSYLSTHDPLTNLPNRIQFNDRLSQALTQAHKNRMLVAVMFIDLDRFKLFNDTLGHSSGDVLLQMVAKRLLNCVREGDTVARLGGDEFTIILPHVVQMADINKVAQRMLDNLAQPFNLNGQELFITASIGISAYPTDGDNIESIVKNADSAMYRAKELGNNKYRFFAPAMNEAAMERLNMENSLRKALNREELLVHYQPIIDLYTGYIIGMEALVRWQHPELGLISPDKFIPLAEDTGLIMPLGERVLRVACQQNKTWQDEGFPPMYVSVNLSARQFRQHNLVESIFTILRETELSPEYLQLEITESIAVNNEEGVIARLQALKNMGIQIAIDDFGTGYSSLSCLKRFPIDMLKIDKSFIDNISLDPYDPAITTAIINMASSLNLKVIAEGVESEAQLAFLLEKGCNAMQGYLFCKPLPAEEFEDMLIHRKWLNFSGFEAAVTALN
ncbi:MAG TPA: EAL domain-containing protein [Candidatus Deferrimicrobium sp.]|nr:EAL domain-containing protein [Candidatus Deferrimicrobium sp.]